jgi:ferredoxin
MDGAGSTREEDRWVLPGPRLGDLVQLLVDTFDEVIGPVVDGGAIRLRPITSVRQLPVGVTDEQETASYRLHVGDDARRFSYAVGPDSLKAIVHPPTTPVWTMRRRDGSLVVDPALHPQVRRAVIGVRDCDLRGLAVLEHTQLDGPHPDPSFAARRAGLFLVAVDCTHPAPTCFCDTVGGSLTATTGYDLALTEVETRDGIAYLVRSGTDRGRAVVDRLALVGAPPSLVRRAHLDEEYATRDLVREMPDDAADAVRDPFHPRWDDVAARCLTCGNCTAVCPTCFCTDLDDRVGIDGEAATRTRVWDTCFSLEYSHLGPGPQRASAASRYRQWLTHKLGTWHDQFGESGCVGCGRCITWCPVGIDLTAEVEALGRPDAPVALEGAGATS